MKRKKKVRCRECKAQHQGFCVTKRVSVSINKKRHCDKFQHDQAKIKIKQVLPTTRVGFSEQEKIRKQRKEDLRKLRAHLKKEGLLNDNLNIPKPKEEAPPESRIYKPHGDEKYPLTGDLSRFTTTGTKEDEEKEES